MIQGLVLHFIATESAYKMIWMEENNKNFYSCIATYAIQIIYVHFRLQRNTVQALVSYYKPALTPATVYAGTSVIIVDWV